MPQPIDGFEDHNTLTSKRRFQKVISLGNPQDISYNKHKRLERRELGFETNKRQRVVGKEEGKKQVPNLKPNIDYKHYILK